MCISSPDDTAIVLGKPMNRDLMQKTPDPGEELRDFKTYINLGKRRSLSLNSSDQKVTGRLRGPLLIQQLNTLPMPSSQVLGSWGPAVGLLPRNTVPGSA